MTDDTKGRLLEAAGEVFSEKGFEAATVREICDRAGANIASVNYYFGDKQRLYLDAVREAQCVRVEQVPMPQWDPDTPADVRLRGFIHTMLGRMIHDPRPAWHRGADAARTVRIRRRLAHRWSRTTFAPWPRS